MNRKHFNRLIDSSNLQSFIDFAFKVLTFKIQIIIIIITHLKSKMLIVILLLKKKLIWVYTLVLTYRQSHRIENRNLSNHMLNMGLEYLIFSFDD